MEIEKENQIISNLLAEQILERYISSNKGKIALATSFSIEDQVLTDLVLKIDPNIKIFTLDTGRLYSETHQLIDRTNEHFDIKVDIYYPNNFALEKFVKEKGSNSFYESLENRKQCCDIRKIEPLKRALKGIDIWIAGLRKEQSLTRTNLKIIDKDLLNENLKLYPLLNWTEDEVWEYIKKNNIPYNPLYNKGFSSIGCAPCTRAVTVAGDIRSGRWWWENPETKECGLHLPKGVSNG
ncbi:MAG: phosphoadenylyl-sulfate reductase [Melioribacteraceae bacterium]|nr:phosphoadenylyl-sulfate reductase [Melioribacteraceae bacterium]